MELTLTGGSLSTKRISRPKPKPQQVANITDAVSKHLNAPIELDHPTTNEGCEHCKDEKHQHSSHFLQIPKEMLNAKNTNDAFERILSSSNTEARATALASAVKVGNYEGFVRLSNAILKKEKSEHDLEEYKTIQKQSLLTQYIGDFTLAHWAAKRQDHRFLEYLSGIPGGLEILSLPSLDNIGMCPIHWAATTGHIPTCAFLLQKVILLPQSSQNNQPNLYSATESFTDYDSHINTRDKGGNTPLIVAAQYGHADLCAFFVKRGAYASAVDSSQDSALHWAAYKGATPVVGLLCYIGWNRHHQSNDPSNQMMIQHHENNYEKYKNWLPLEAVDAYGQSPLHLASLRGNAEVVQYLLEEAQNRQMALLAHTNHYGNNQSNPNLQLHSRQGSDAVRYLLTLTDKDGKTPLDLAIKKSKASCVVVLQEWEERLNIGAHSFPTSVYAKALKIIKSLTSRKQWKLWLGMGLGNDGDSSYIQLQNMVYPFAGLVGVMVLCLSSYIYYFTPLWNTERGILWDHLFLHLSFYLFGTLSTILFYKTWTTNPGVLGEDYDSRNQHLTSIEKELQALTLKYRRLYDETIESYAKITNDDQELEQQPKLALCHSCHIAKPYRSKHCRVRRKCVLMFDHYCPFVGNVVGLYNYAYFYSFLLCAVLSILNFLHASIIYIYRAGTLDPFLFFVSAILAICLLPGFTLLVYHTQLVNRELTTNEHQNGHRYEYLKDEFNQYYNPWNRGFVKNLLRRFSPCKELYTLPRKPPSLALACASSCCVHRGTDDTKCEKDSEKKGLISHQV